jgi:hypothetical protein
VKLLVPLLCLCARRRLFASRKLTLFPRTSALTKDTMITVILISMASTPSILLGLETERLPRTCLQSLIRCGSWSGSHSSSAGMAARKIHGQLTMQRLFKRSKQCPIRLLEGSISFQRGLSRQLEPPYFYWYAFVTFSSNAS